MFSDENIYNEDTRPSQLMTKARRYITIDYGTSNPMVFLDCYDDGKTIWIDNEYYYDSKVRQAQKTDNKYADDFDIFVNKSPIKPSLTIIDPSALSFRTELLNRRYRVKNANNEVIDGIRRVSTMIDKKRLKVNSRCVNLLREIKSYVWDNKAFERGEEKPVKLNDHALDAIRYLISTIINDRRLAD